MFPEGLSNEFSPRRPLTASGSQDEGETGPHGAQEGLPQRPACVLGIRGASDRGAHVAPSQITGTTRVALGTWAAMLPWGKATRFSQCICEPGHSEQAGHRLGWALPRGSWLEHRQACRSLGWNGQGVAWPRGPWGLGGAVRPALGSWALPLGCLVLGARS